jgi:hypothetical protein
MRYYENVLTDIPTTKELKALGKSIRDAFPDGPRIMYTTFPDRMYTFNEIAQNIRVQQRAISASLYS